MKEVKWDKKGRCYRGVDSNRKINNLKPIGGLEKIFCQHSELPHPKIEAKAREISKKPDYYEIVLPARHMDDWGFYTYIVKFYTNNRKKGA